MASVSGMLLGGFRTLSLLIAQKQSRCAQPNLVSSSSSYQRILPYCLAWKAAPLLWNGIVTLTDQ
jgi:hypothetical protein